MVTTRGGARQTHRAADVFVSLASVAGARDGAARHALLTAGARWTRACLGKPAGGCAGMDVAGDGLLGPGRGSFARRTRQSHARHSEESGHALSISAAR